MLLYRSGSMYSCILLCPLKRLGQGCINGATKPYERKNIHVDAVNLIADSFGFCRGFMVYSFGFYLRQNRYSFGFYHSWVIYSFGFS